MYFSNISSTFYTLYMHVHIKHFIYRHQYIFYTDFILIKHTILKEGESVLAMGLPVAVAEGSTKTYKGEFILY